MPPCNARIAVLWKRKSVLKSCRFSRTNFGKEVYESKGQYFFGIYGFHAKQLYLDDNDVVFLHPLQLVQIYVRLLLPIYVYVHMNNIFVLVCVVFTYMYIYKSMNKNVCFNY